MRRIAVVAVVAVLGLLAGFPAASGTARTGQPFPPRIDLPDGFFPEGITTGRGTTVFTGSLVDGAIWRGDVRTGEGTIFVEGRAGSTSVGVDYERGRDRLWVVGGPLGTVTAYDATTGARLRTYDFGGGFLNDVVVTRHGVYATDSFNQRLAIVPLDRSGALPPRASVMSLPLRGDVEYVPGEFNANGIVAFRGGRVLVLVQSVTGELFTVDPGTGGTRRIDLGGQRLVGGDGLERRGRTLYVVRGGVNAVEVVRLHVGLRRGAVVGRLTGELDFPSTATLAAGRLWVVNARFTTPRTPSTEYWITRLSPR